MHIRDLMPWSQRSHAPAAGAAEAGTSPMLALQRDINRMFEGLVVAESVLLKSSTRETLFRKP